MRRAPGIGDRASCANTDARQPVDQRSKHGGFPAMQVIGTGGVDDDPIGRIGRDDRCEALQHPEGEPVERLGIRNRVGIFDDETRDQDLGLGRRHANAKAGGVRRGIRRQHHPPPSVPAYQYERRLRRRRRVAGLPSDPVRGQGRKEERDDPCHRTPPIRNLRFRRRGT